MEAKRLKRFFIDKNPNRYCMLLLQWINSARTDNILRLRLQHTRNNSNKRIYAYLSLLHRVYASDSGTTLGKFRKISRSLIRGSTYYCDTLTSNMCKKWLISEDNHSSLNCLHDIKYKDHMNFFFQSNIILRNIIYPTLTKN